MSGHFNCKAGILGAPQSPHRPVGHPTQSPETQGSAETEKTWDPMSQASAPITSLVSLKIPAPYTSLFLWFRAAEWFKFMQKHVRKNVSQVPLTSNATWSSVGTEHRKQMTRSEKSQERVDFVVTISSSSWLEYYGVISNVGLES